MLGDLALPGKLEFNDVPSDSNVLRAQRSQTIAAILVRVYLTSRTHKTRRQYSHDTGHDALASQIFFSQILAHDSAHFRDGLAKLQQTVEFLMLSLLYVIFVVNILPATSRIFADCLKHSTGCVVDRYISPGWRKSKCVDSSEIRSSYLTAIGGNIPEAALSTAPPNPCCLKSFNMSHEVNQLVRKKFFNHAVGLTDR